MESWVAGVLIGCGICAAFGVPPRAVWLIAALNSALGVALHQFGVIP